MTKKYLSLAVAGSLIAGNAWAASSCVRPEDEVAMRAAALQQQLMVAAFTCGEVGRYNEFVILHQGELQQTDAALLAFFVRENGESGTDDYHTFKTKAANVSALQSARDLDRFCANADGIFRAALDSYQPTLASFVYSEWSATSQFISTSCTDDESYAERTARAQPSYEGPVAHAPMDAMVAAGEGN
jgi:hypothetical protein